MYSPQVNKSTNIVVMNCIEIEISLAEFRTPGGQSGEHTGWPEPFKGPIAPNKGHCVFLFIWCYYTTNIILLVKKWWSQGVLWTTNMILVLTLIVLFVVKGEISLDEGAETLTLTFPDPLPVGDGSLHIVYKGILNDKMKGFYRSKYTTPSGEERYAAVTQFEVSWVCLYVCPSVEWRGTAM